jgi:hypothetical protein
LPEFEVRVLTVRSGTHTLRIQAEDAGAARGAVDSECSEDRCHCPAHWCTDDVQSEVRDVKPVAAAYPLARSTAPARVQPARNRPSAHLSG